MSYSDNIENNLKALESREEAGVGRGREHKARLEAAKAKAAVAPFSEQLRRGPFTAELMDEAVRLGHGLRTKVYISWLDGALRMDARHHRLELKPTPAGVMARFTEEGKLTKEEPIKLDGSAKKLAERWMAAVGPRPE